MIKRSAGFSLLEIQISALLAAFVFAGLALTLTMQADQVAWLESHSASTGTTAPTAFVAASTRVVNPATPLTGRFEVDVQSVVEDGPTLVVTVQRRAAAADDCGP